MNLHLKQGVNNWCGPAALEVVTGLHSDNFEHLLSDSGGMSIPSAIQALRSLTYQVKYHHTVPNYQEWQDYNLGRIEPFAGNFTLKRAQIYFTARYGHYFSGLLILVLRDHFAVYRPATQEIVDNGTMFKSYPTQLASHNLRSVVYAWLEVLPSQHHLENHWH